MPRNRAMYLTLAATLGLVLGSACDRKWDFECTAVWEARDGKELSREVKLYPQMADENAATAACRDEMLAEPPKRAKAATCHCIGKD